jgi:hypothetical protein
VTSSISSLISEGRPPQNPNRGSAADHAVVHRGRADWRADRDGAAEESLAEAAAWAGAVVAERACSYRRGLRQSGPTTTREEAGEGEDGAAAAHIRWLRKGGGGEDAGRFGGKIEPWLEEVMCGDAQAQPRWGK